MHAVFAYTFLMQTVYITAYSLLVYVGKLSYSYYRVPAIANY